MAKMVRIELSPDTVRRIDVYRGDRSYDETIKMLLGLTDGTTRIFEIINGNEEYPRKSMIIQIRYQMSSGTLTAGRLYLRRVLRGNSRAIIFSAAQGAGAIVRMADPYSDFSKIVRPSLSVS